jgi:hypothetical protein
VALVVHFALLPAHQAGSLFNCLLVLLLLQAEHLLKPENWACVEKARVAYSAGFFITGERII